MGADDLFFCDNIPCILLSGRIVIFSQNSKCLSMVKRTKPFASVSTPEKCPGKCSWGLESCTTFVYHSSNTVSPKYLISHVFLSMASNQAMFGHHPYHNTTNCLTCCWHAWGTVYTEIILADPVILADPKKKKGCNFVFNSTPFSGFSARIWFFLTYKFQAAQV